MMQTERTRPNTLPLSMSGVEEHLRLTWAQEEQQTLQAMVTAATVEIEERAGLAILSQTITVTTDCEAGTDIALPVGPVATGATATVSTLGDDGTVTALASGFWLEAGRWPVLHLTDTSITGRLVVAYTAGMATVPADVRHAISDQVALMYDQRGMPTQGLALSMSAAALIARRGRVRL
jgi:uncharacterized phiE125 gp8 family phage protein